jgi:hypothetical protein
MKNAKIPLLDKFQLCTYQGRKCRVLHYDKKKKMYRINVPPGWAKPEDLEVMI